MPPYRKHRRKIFFFSPQAQLRNLGFDADGKVDHSQRISTNSLISNPDNPEKRTLYANSRSSSVQECLYI